MMGPGDSDDPEEIVDVDRPNFYVWAVLRDLSRSAIPTREPRTSRLTG